MANEISTVRKPPQDCRSRGDCGSKFSYEGERGEHRLKIAAVAATAAWYARRAHGGLARLKIAAVAATAARADKPTLLYIVAASRLPQSRRLRL